MLHIQKLPRPQTPFQSLPQPQARQEHGHSCHQIQQLRQLLLPEISDLLRFISQERQQSQQHNPQVQIG